MDISALSAIRTTKIRQGEAAQAPEELPWAAKSRRGAALPAREVDCGASPTPIWPLEGNICPSSVLDSV